MVAIASEAFSMAFTKWHLQSGIHQVSLPERCPGKIQTHHRKTSFVFAPSLLE
jgi:hypothetical protein